jgi:hypothetical protein
LSFRIELRRADHVAGHDANQAEAERSRRVIDEVLADHARVA